MNDVIQYENHRLDIITINSIPWLLASQIGTAIGLASPMNGVRKIFNRHKKEFTTDMSTMIEIQTAAGPRLTRIYSLRGLALICMLAKTEPAARFRVWALDALEKQPDAESRTALPALERPKNLRALSKEARLVLKCRSAGLTMAETMGAARLTRSGVEDISASLRAFGLLAAHHG